MNASSDITIIRARLPYIDRRALSQAWYAALRLGAGAGMLVPMRPLNVAPVAQARAVGRQRTAERTASSKLAVHSALDKKGFRSQRSGTQQSPASSAERSHRAKPPCFEPPLKTMVVYGAGFTVTLGDARVRIVVRSDGKRLALTAVCSSRHAETVRLALAHASLGLRMHGTRVDATLHCEESLT